jgi:CTP synthase
MASYAKVKVKFIEAEDLEKNTRLLQGVDGILVPGGFGSRGVPGKCVAIRYAREHKIPFLGICLGMQCTVIEFARNVLGWKDANSTEFDPETKHPVIDLMEEQKKITDKGGTMRLGAYPCKLTKGSTAAKAYGTTEISERHRHRYELNYDSESCKALEKAGLKVVGLSPDKKLVEVVELPDHPYFVACQFHPEFKSRPTTPHPLFDNLVKAALKYKGERERKGGSKAKKTSAK